MVAQITRVAMCGVLRLPGLLVICGCLLPAPLSAQRGDSSLAAREAMVRREVTGRGVRDARVVAAMQAVPRHEFVPADYRRYSYADAAIPIGHGQTITSPFVVAFMTEQLEPQATDRVLEIGTGSGYQASILSQLVADVYTIEIVEPLGQRAARTIERLGYSNVHFKIGDGYQGWPEHAPFDKIIVTCSPEHVPPALVAQLREGGRLIIPLGERFQQSLFLFRKVDGQLRKEKLDATFFVPMTGQAEQLREDKSDSGVPEIVNGSFEQTGPDADIAGWYYVLQAQVVRDDTTTAGRQVLALANTTPGNKTHALQALGLDGRKVHSVALSALVRTTSISGSPAAQLARIELTFYDERRAPIRTAMLGPWQGDRAWSRERLEVPVPGRTRLAVLAVGIFGAIGQMAVDDVQIEARPSP